MSDRFAAFCEDEYDRLVGALTLWCGQRPVAEEVVQEAFARAYRDWHRISGYDNPGTWVRRVAMNLATSRFRRWQAERRARQQLVALHDDTYHDPDPAQGSEVRAALGHLTEAQRTAVVLRYYLDLPIAEVAEITDRSTSAVTSLTNRALVALRDRLDIDGLPDDSPQGVHHE